MKYKNYTIVLSTLVIGILFSGSLFFWLLNNELEFTQEKFSSLISQYAKSTETALNDETHLLNALSAYHYGSEFISRDEFKEFSSVLLKEHANVQALGWVPVVSLDEKKDYKKRGFYFTQRDKDGKIVPVGERSVYYPVYYMEPYKGNEKDHGFDLGSEKNILKSLLSAKNSTDIVASEAIKLVHEKWQQSVITIIQPVYKNQKEKKELDGFYLNVIRVGTLIENAISRFSKQCPGVNLNVYSISENNEKSLLHSRRCRSNKPEVAGIVAKESITFAGRVWRFEATATEMFASHYMTSYPYIILGTLILLTLLISSIFYMMQRSYGVVIQSNEHLRRFQKLAVGREQRISELKKENMDLKNRHRSSHEE